MATDPGGDNQRQLHGERNVYGPRPIGTLLPGVTRPAFRRRAPAAAQLMADWPAIVGPAIAAVTTPRKLASGTLALGCCGPVALELQHLAGEVMARINTHLGRITVQRLRFVQDSAAAPFATPPARTRAEVKLPASALAGMPEGPLRDALTALGSAVLTAG